MTTEVDEKKVLRVDLEDFPRGGEFNLGKLGLGVLRAQRDQNTGKPYVECDTEEQVYALKQITGIPGPPIELQQRTKEFPGLTTHDKNVAQCKTLIEETTHRAALTQLMDEELGHPKYQGGRPGVIKLIQERLTQVRDQ